MIEHLPVTNIKKFETNKCGWFIFHLNLINNVRYVKEGIMLSVGLEKNTTHYHQHLYDNTTQQEGIIITWEGNIFNI